MEDHSDKENNHSSYFLSYLTPAKSTATSMSLFDSEVLTKATKASLRSILSNLNLSTYTDDKETLDKSFDVIIGHLSQYSFNTEFTRSIEFLSSVKDTAMRFYETIHKSVACLLTMSDARAISSLLIGKRRKIVKKRKLLMDDKEREDEEHDYEQHMMFDAVFFLLFLAIKSNELQQQYFYSEAKYLEAYGDMSQPYNYEDLDTIIFYRNIMKCAMTLITPSGNKGYLLDFVTRLVEGVHKKYITGSGATIDTKRRVKIYEVEGGIVIAIRPERRKIKEAKMLGSLGTLRPSDPLFSLALTTKSLSTSKYLYKKYNIPSSGDNSSNAIATMAKTEIFPPPEKRPLRITSKSEMDAAESILSIISSQSLLA